ncbi:type VI secretion protein, VC_A0114 family [Arcobacter nitrofigilis DSM 7299]|uniref:Type VI secretion protein, VC_A0114 family n=1 Tax=Arcobacter nitrofigilis (strain ATCC 33309 / DSM 7299 / CCUG 15893 / LMG 7604 / NCTC 12251 / CI) TaxID=572480 RepID=D5V1H1_ARCNC|nr:type VI secretion system baseplate subunit TssK [Arcobacter nitrofigilis]ADG93405.1 type VI secretion protein, VC_A0114 family [Arcobacter nitrofigilis DSM 7299]
MQNNVVWKEGLFIRPQHFQQSDRYYNNEIITRTLNARPNNWGFYNLEIDEHLLNTGKIVIKRASGIMPDGTLFNIDPKVNSLILNIEKIDSGKNVYLALPIFIDRSDTVHFEDQKNLSTRLKAVNSSNIPNTNAGENSSCDILTAELNFKLLLEEELNENYTSLLITKVGSVSTSNIVSLDTNFTPTFLHLDSASVLSSKIKEILSMISYRIKKLSEKISDSSLQATELSNYLMLQLLNKAENKFHFLISQNKVHPDILFYELSNLVAELAIFMKKEKRIINHITYLHYQQSESFDKLITELKDMLTLVLDENSISLPIEKRKFGIYISALKDKKIVQDSTFIFSVSTSMPSNKIKEILVASLKLGTIETIKNLVNFHLIGFKIKPLSTPPKEIPYRVNLLYFKIELTQENRDELMKSAGFAFHLGSEIPDISYSLWAIKNNN